MQTYKTFRPTGFDAAGIGADRHGIGEYLVLLTRNRDSGILEESNFDCALESLGGESDAVQVHRFGHWACGWFELLLIDPADETVRAEAESIEAALEDYPILSEDDYSRRQYETASEAWTRASIADRVDTIQRYGRSERVSVFAARHDDMPAGLYYEDWLTAGGM